MAPRTAESSETAPFTTSSKNNQKTTKVGNNTLARHNQKKRVGSDDLLVED